MVKLHKQIYSIANFINLLLEMSQQHALRLGQLHNHEDFFHHELTTTDKVCNLLTNQVIYYDKYGHKIWWYLVVVWWIL